MWCDVGLAQLRPTSHVILPGHQNSVLIGFLYEIADTCFSVCQSFLCDIKIYVFEKLNFRLFVEYFVIIFISLPYYIFDSSTKKWNYADFYKKILTDFYDTCYFCSLILLKKNTNPLLSDESTLHRYIGQIVYVV